MKSFTKKIIECKLVKIEKLYNQSYKQKFFYSLQLEGIDEILILESNERFTQDVTGSKIKYKLNSENEVSDFAFL